MTRLAPHSGSELARQPEKRPQALVPPDGWTAVGTIRDGSGASARITLLQGKNGNRVVLKDFSHRGFLFRRTAGALMASREISAYRRLTSVRGVPRLVSRVGADGILISYIDCRAPETSPGGLSDGFFEELRRILGRLRERGVIHGDVCRNVRVGHDGNPWLMDFGASFVVRGWMWPIRDPLLRIVRRYNDRDVAVLKYRVAHDLLTSADREEIGSPLPFRRMLILGQNLLHGAVRRVFGSRSAAGRAGD